MSRPGRARPLLAGALVLGATAVPASAARPTEPPRTVGRASLEAAYACHGDIGRRRPAPVLFAPGTGSDGSQVHALGGAAFEAIGRPLCTVSFPDRTTADLQVSVQYLVHAIRAVARRAGRPITVAGVSQGGLLARMALTYWPSLRPQVADVVTAAGTHHGSLGTPEQAARCLQEGCPPALWQQAARSRLLRALNDGRDETPGPTAYTTIRSATDEVLRPVATAKLHGAVNVLVQRVCPGRTTTHIGTAVDSVTFALLDDAIRHRGPARVSRLPGDVCSHPYATGLDEGRTGLFLDIAAQLRGQGAGGGVPVVRQEPRVRAWMGRRP